MNHELSIINHRIPAGSLDRSQVLSDPRSRAEYDAELRCRGVDAGGQGHDGGRGGGPGSIACGPPWEMMVTIRIHGGPHGYYKDG